MGVVLLLVGGTAFGAVLCAVALVAFDARRVDRRLVSWLAAQRALRSRMVRLELPEERPAPVVTPVPAPRVRPTRHRRRRAIAPPVRTVLGKVVRR